MKFNNLVINIIFPIIKNYGFDLIEVHKNIIRFQSEIIKLNFAFNEKEKSNYVEIGRKNEQMYPLNDNLIRIIFKSELKIENVTTEIFLKNLSNLFQSKEGEEILKGKIDKIIIFIKNESKKYTFNLILQQKLDAALKAWETNDYKEFIKIIENIDYFIVPNSFKIKYKIAKEKYKN